MEQRFDRSLIAKTYTNDSGFLIAENAIVTRTGVFTYQNADGTLRKELRHPDDVLQTESLNTLKLLPLTLNHPNVDVNQTNLKELQVGNVGDSYYINGEFISVCLTVQDAEAIRKVKSGQNQQLSLGYSTDVIEESGVYNNIEYDFRQTNIRYNHLALVEKARAGDKAKINLDSADINVSANINLKENKDETMTDETRVDKEHEDKEKMDAMNKKMADMKEKMDKLMAERDAYKDKLDKMQKDTAKKDSIDEKARFDSAVAEKAKSLFTLNAMAKDIDKDFEFKLDADDITIKKQVLTKALPELKLDGKDDAYINARFEILHEDSLKAKAEAPIAEQRSKVFGDVAKQKNFDGQKSYDSYLTKLQNAYKKEAK